MLFLKLTLVKCPKTIVCNSCQFADAFAPNNNNEKCVPMEEVYNFVTSYFVQTSISDIENIGELTTRMHFKQSFDKDKDRNEKKM